MGIFWGLLAVGFVACVTIGSIAWYSSKRPAGWENTETPGWVAKITPKGLQNQSQSDDAGDS